MALTRRKILAGAALGGGLAVAWALMPRRFDDALAPEEGEHRFGVWIRIGEDGVVTVAVPQLEMGQGVTTLLPQIVAHELGADWRQIAVEPAPISAAFANTALAARWASLWMPLAPSLASDPESILARRFAESHRFMATGDGTTLQAYETACREAAASARAMLLEAAARRWGVAAEACEAQGGFALYGSKRLRFAEIAAEAAQLEPPAVPPLRPQAYAEDPSAAIEGDPPAYPRLDLPSKVDGSHVFSGDVRLPGMVYAAIRHGPLDRAELTNFAASNARTIKGLIKVVRSKRWLAAVAHTSWAAERALDAMKPRFAVEDLVDSARIDAVFDEAIERGEGQAIARRGAGFPEDRKPQFEVDYDIGFHSHATIETTSATARYDREAGRLELWIASQAPEQARVAAARAIGLAPEEVILYPMPAGGSFDRRYEHDHAIEVAQIAREIDRPVQLVWSRWQEVLRARPRHRAVLRLSAWVSDPETRGIEAFKARIAAPSANHELAQRLFENKTAWAARRAAKGRADPLVCEGAMPFYAIADCTVEHVSVDQPLACSRLRGNAHGYTAFAVESLIDEIASAHWLEPLSFRISMLGQDPRMVECLQRAARLAQWGGGGERSGQGIACHRIGDAASGGRIACVATARQGEGGVRVERLSAAVDIGRIVNLDIARQQIEGSLIFGLSLTMGSSLRYARGLPQTAGLGGLNLPRLGDCPRVEVEFIASDAPSADPGELGVAVAPPAIANALHSATGLRFRRLPLLSEGV